MSTAEECVPVMEYRCERAVALSPSTADAGLRDRDLLNTGHFLAEPRRQTRPNRRLIVMKTGQLLAIIASLGLVTTACTADHGNRSPSTADYDWPFEQSQGQSDTQSPPAGSALAANPDDSRPVPAQGSWDGVYSGSAFPVNTGGGICIRKERISDFRVEGDSVRWRAFRGRIRNNNLRMVHGNTWIIGQFTGDRFNGQVIMSGRFGAPQCTFAMTLDRTGA